MLMDVLDEWGLSTGQALPKEVIHQQGLLHRAVHLYLMDFDGNLLVQKRAPQVDYYPGLVSISLTGHVDAGESSQIALYRELQEELGLESCALPIQFLFSYRQDIIVSPTYVDRQFNDVYFCRCTIKKEDLALNPQEVSSVFFIPFDQYAAKIAEKDSLLHQIYGREFQEVQRFLPHL